MPATGSPSSTASCGTRSSGASTGCSTRRAGSIPRLGDEKHVYGISFVLYAASTVREVTGDELALKVARDAFDWLDQHAHDAKHGGYFEALRRDGTPILRWDEGAPIARRTDRLGVYYGFKTMNVAHPPAGGGRRPVAGGPASGGEGPAARAARPRPRQDRRRAGRTQPLPDPDWRAIPAHDSFGHDVETAYLLVEAAEALGMPDDAKTWEVARSLVDHALDWGWDDEHGGFYDKGESFGGPAFDTQEGLVDPGRGSQRPAADAPEVRRPDRPLRKALSASSGTSSRSTCSTRSTAAGSPRRPARAS